MPDILFIVSFPPKLHSSARFRIELYENALKNADISYKMEYFWNERMYDILYKPGNTLTKTKWLMAGLLKRIGLFTSIRKYNYIFILREACPIGPPFFEWVASKIFKKKIVYDFDDAIWIEQASENNAIAKFVKAVGKVKNICKWAYKVSVGNKYLYDYAIQYNNRVILNPTCVDTVNQHNIIREQDTNKIVIGWTGSFSTLHYLNDLIPVLEKLEKQYDFEFLVIADQNPNFSLKSFRFQKWNEQTEVADLISCNIGVMPLYDSEFTKGKCGFKIIQFLSLGIPVVASPIGVNTQIVDENVNGFLCNSPEEWVAALEKLLSDATLRKTMGVNGRKKIEDHYSEISNRANFLSLFE